MVVRANYGERACLRIQNDNLVFEKDGRVIAKMSGHRTFAVFVIGDIVLTVPFLRKARELAVSVFILKHNLDYCGGFSPVAEGHTVLRSAQYIATTERELELARTIVMNKVENQLNLLKERKIITEDDVTAELVKSANSVKIAEDSQQLLGIEGSSTRTYFGKYFETIKWRRRAPRTKEDIPNFLLDMGYTYLFNFTDALLRLHGFDTYKGIYHKLFFQRRSLACDLVEPMRSIIDRQLLKAYNLRQVRENDFKVVNGQYTLTFQSQKPYIEMFTGVIMDAKESIYQYVHGYYQHFLKPEVYEMPTFRIIS